jgi:hypothetical protein
MRRETTSHKEVEEESEEGNEKEIESNAQVSIAAPMFFWLLLLVIAVVINALINAGYIPSGKMLSILKASANFILFMPGSIILPTIVGAFIGAEIGRRSKSMYIAIKSGIINGVYATIVYLIAIFIIYEIIIYILPNINPGVNFFAEDWLAMPTAILIALSVLFAGLSHARKVS